MILGLDSRFVSCYIVRYGALAQLGARHTGSVEVTGSNPVCSIWNDRRLSERSEKPAVFLVQGMVEERKVFRT